MYVYCNFEDKYSKFRGHLLFIIVEMHNDKDNPKYKKRYNKHF